MRILSAVGARPQFIKAGPISKALKAHGIEEVLVHSGQHYDSNMSDLFFEELGLPEPARNLGIGSGTHASQTAAMLVGFEDAILHYKPDWVLVHGDTNSTLAAALAATKLGVKVAHNEAGLRSFNRSMPEEYNRILTDHCSDLMFCPTQRAFAQLRKEGIAEGVHYVGDVMYDCLLNYQDVAAKRNGVMQALGLEEKQFVLVTIHRAYNVDQTDRLECIIRALANVKGPFVLPVHPRLKAKIEAFDIRFPSTVLMIEPIGYLDMLQLERSARIVVTDSGGVQKEAYMFATPCVTLRPETEWMETVEAGWNRITDVNVERIRDALSSHWWPSSRPEIFGNGQAAHSIADILKNS